MNKKIESNGVFKGINNQPFAISLLEATINKKHLSPAYIFSGPKGVGQKTAAIRFFEGLITDGVPTLSIRKRLEELNFPDLLWIEPTYSYQGDFIKKSAAKDLSLKSGAQIRLEQIKEVKEFLGKETLESKFGMVVIEEADLMNESSSNALLKTLEEPSNGILILISSKAEKLLPTIKSRCKNIPFKPLGFNTIKHILSNHEDYKDNKLLLHYKEELINISDGSPSLLEENIGFLNSIPDSILVNFQEYPSNHKEALELAREISEQLNLSQQIWLINFLQQYFWRKKYDVAVTRKINSLEVLLNSSVQPRIAWEVTLIGLISETSNK